MATNVEIDCINKEDRLDPTERIRRVGGPNGDGKRWKLDLDDAIKGVETGQWQFFVRRGIYTVRVVVATSRAGRKYLKTEADGYEPNNLLSLRECG